MNKMASTPILTNLIFSQAMEPIVSFLRRIRLRLIINLDHIIIMNQSKEILKDRHSLVHLLNHLGFVVNQKKYVLILSQKIDFRGFMIDSVKMILSLPRTK